MKHQWRFRGNEIKYINEVLVSGETSSTGGNFNNRFEKLFAEKVGAKFAVTFNSGTSTLHAALDALDVKFGDEVIVPPITVISNFDVIIASNAVPVFVDVDPYTYNLDINDLESKITKKTKAIMPISVYGLSCDLDPIMEIAKKYNIGVINDAAEAHGSTYNNRLLGGIADITSYSTENTKHITTGDGGIVVTNEEHLATKMRKFGSLGYALMKAGEGRIRLDKSIFQDPSYKRHDSYALNYRMPEVAAAVGLAQTERLEEFINLRISIGELMRDVASSSDLLIPQKKIEGCQNTYWTFAARMMNNEIKWQEFRSKFIEFGGESIFGCWALTYDEPVVSEGYYKKHNPILYEKLNFEKGTCPNAETIQPQLMLFPTNYETVDEGQMQAEALSKTLKYFDN